MFANAEGKRGGQFYTPASIVKTLVAVLAPHQGKVYDPCCGSGGMFVQSEKFIEAHGGKLGDVSIYGQEANPTTWRLAAMNLAIRGIDFNLGREPADTFVRNQHPDLRADFILANPPFNISDWWHGSLEGEQLGLSDDEVRFYDALANNESAVKELTDETLKKIAHELTENLKKNITVDWAQRESVRATLRLMVKRILRKYKYPPDQTDAAIELVLQQAESIGDSWG
ncbi:N-6 DNA methylase [Acidovorax sp. MR-S7]|uniref:N-6 DNA methylase n=1 Tax=Acidovorax sp. MR-S7 TaxID=1268622 RepID=UPI000366E316|nr:N-6 DNA methylase [Acidovorax sp. MR-S7]